MSDFDLVLSGTIVLPTTIIENGFLAADIVESEARVFHDDLDVVEIMDERDHRAEKVTVPIPPVKMTIRA